MFTDQTKIGLEIEIGPTRADISVLGRIFSPFKFQIHDDGSCRDRTFRIQLNEKEKAPANMGIIPPINDKGDYAAPMFMRYINATGLEIVFDPVSYKDAVLLSHLIKDTFSHVQASNHTGIHIHVDVRRKPFWYIKNVILLFYYHEAFLYRLSAGGNVHRGEKYTERGYKDYSGCINHRFARPLSDSIGVEYIKEGWVNLIDIDELIHATSFSQLLKAWGRMDMLGWPRVGHFAPHRLHGINIQSVAEHGSLELRIFNAVYKYMPQFLEITAALFKQAWDLGKKDPSNFYEPSLLGQEGKGFDDSINLKDIEKILNVEIEPGLWGNKWVKAPSELTRHHYSTERYRLSREADIVRVPSISGAMVDDYSPEFIPWDDNNV